MSTVHRLLKFARQLHLYLGVFAAPALLFFAITGGLQSFGLHESARGSSYTPPAWLALTAQLHKKQTTVVSARRARPPAVEIPKATGSGALANDDMHVMPTRPRATPTAAASRTPPPKNLLPMKIFFGWIALSLVTSTLTGLYMAYRYSRRPWRVNTVLLAGVLVPLLLWWL